MDFESLTLDGAEWTLVFDHNNLISEVSLSLPKSWRNMLHDHFMKRTMKVMSNTHPLHSVIDIYEYYEPFVEDMVDDVLIQTISAFSTEPACFESDADFIAYVSSRISTIASDEFRNAVVQEFIEECNWNNENFMQALLQYTYSQTRTAV